MGAGAGTGEGEGECTCTCACTCACACYMHIWHTACACACAMCARCVCKTACLYVHACCMYVHRMNYRVCMHSIACARGRLSCVRWFGPPLQDKMRTESVPWSITVEKLFGGHIAQLRGPTEFGNCNSTRSVVCDMTWVKLIVLAAVGLANVEAAPTREGVLTHEGAVAATARKQLFSSTPTPPDSDTVESKRPVQLSVSLAVCTVVAACPPTPRPRGAMPTHVMRLITYSRKLSSHSHCTHSHTYHQGYGFTRRALSSRTGIYKIQHIKGVERDGEV